MLLNYLRTFLITVSKAKNMNHYYIATFQAIVSRVDWHEEHNRHEQSIESLSSNKVHQCDDRGFNIWQLLFVFINYYLIKSIVDQVLSKGSELCAAT